MKIEQLKFRAKVVIATVEFRVGDWATSDGIAYQGTVRKIEKFWRLVRTKYLDSSTLGQWTGLKTYTDKATDIYEGDLIGKDDWSVEVRWDDVTGEWIAYSDGDVVVGDNLFLWLAEHADCEVVGTVFDEVKP